MSRGESLREGRLNRNSKELIFFNDLWDLVNQRKNPASDQQTDSVEIEIVTDIVATMLHCLTPLAEQAAVLTAYRQSVTLHYLQSGLPLYEAFDGSDLAELQSNICLVMALLRELHPCYYDLEHLSCLVDSLGQRVRNIKNLNPAVPVQSRIASNAYLN